MAARCAGVVSRGRFKHQTHTLRLSGLSRLRHHQVAESQSCKPPLAALPAALPTYLPGVLASGSWAVRQNGQLSRHGCHVGGLLFFLVRGGCQVARPVAQGAAACRLKKLGSRLPPSCHVALGAEGTSSPPGGQSGSSAPPDLPPQLLPCYQLPPPHRDLPAAVRRLRSGSCSLTLRPATAQRQHQMRGGKLAASARKAAACKAELAALLSMPARPGNKRRACLARSWR